MRYRPTTPIPPGNQAVAANMTRLRSRAGLSQADLGKLLGGWSVASVSAAERSVAGKRVRRFDADEIVQIAGVLGVSPAELIMPPPVCETCEGMPPAGMQCMECSTATPRERQETPDGR
jgi:transcriptional regulator with XRE-family HTH domain